MRGEIVHTEEWEGFKVTLELLPEDDDPRGHFASGNDEDDADIVRKIESGYYLWFVAKVSASKAGIVLGTDYLGGCCYKSAADFMAPDGYYPQMRKDAITEARAKLNELCNHTEEKI